MPPRHGKTSTILYSFGWLLANDPTKTHAFATYAQHLANSKSRTARRIAVEAGVSLASDSKSVSEWRTTREGGLLATGVDGPLTGQGISGLGVIDDPFKNRLEANSSLTRRRVWEWFTDVFYTRLEPGASAIVIATRWHPDDLSGRLINDGWEYINMPALSDDGEPLWADRFSAQRLNAIKRQVGEYTWASLYQGQPVPRGGQVFDGSYTYDEIPDEPYRVGHGFDGAYTAKTHADYSVALTGRRIGDHLYLTGMFRDQVEAKQTVHALRARRIDRIAWFRSGTEKGMEALLDMEGIKVDAYTATGDKFSRAQAVAAAWNDGKVVLPSPDSPYHGPWVETLLSEVLEFTGLEDTHDDIVDALAALHFYLFGTPEPFDPEPPMGWN